MKRRFFTKAELLTIYRDAMADIDPDITAAKLGAKRFSVYQASRTLSLFLSGKKKIAISTPIAYRKALEIIRAETAGKIQMELPKAEEIAAPASTVPTDNLQKLGKAFQVFQEAIADVIVDEVALRSREAVATKEKELATQKEKYEQELLKLQSIIASMKDSSIIGVIQKKWGDR